VALWLRYKMNQNKGETLIYYNVNANGVLKMHFNTTGYYEST